MGADRHICDSCIYVLDCILRGKVCWIKIGARLGSFFCFFSLYWAMLSIIAKIAGAEIIILANNFKFGCICSINIVDPSHIDRLIFLYIEERSRNAADGFRITAVILHPTSNITTVIKLSIVILIFNGVISWRLSRLNPDNIFINTLRIILDKLLEIL